MQENRIQRGDLGQRLTRALEIKGQKSPVLALDNMVAPVVLVEDLTKKKNWLDPTDRVAGSVGVTAAAAFGGACLSNPIGSNVVAVINSFSFYDQGLGGPELILGFWDPANLPVGVNTTRWIDSRTGGSPACLLRDEDAVASRIAIPVRRVIPQSQSMFEQGSDWSPVVLPGEAFGGQSIAPLGANLVFSVIWTEYQI